MTLENYDNHPKACPWCSGREKFCYFPVGQPSIRSQLCYDGDRVQEYTSVQANMTRYGDPVDGRDALKSSEVRVFLGPHTLHKTHTSTKYLFVQYGVQVRNTFGC